jgi:ketosteroid isomerase-like protein
MTDNKALIEAFYSAFQRKDYTTMQSLYHDDAVFSDPVFQNLNATQVRGMWEMLLNASSDLRVEFDQVKATSERGNCHWEAWYTFSKTKRPVHNVIDASFEFCDGKILRHYDNFDLWRWSRQALGPAGLILGWAPFMQNRIRKTGRERLDRFLRS